jgi:hypothetical protein
MPEHEGVGAHLHFLQDEPDDPLAIGEREGLRGLAAHFGHRDHSDRSIVITKIGGS